MLSIQNKDFLEKNHIKICSETAMLEAGIGRYSLLFFPGKDSFAAL